MLNETVFTGLFTSSHRIYFLMEVKDVSKKVVYVVPATKQYTYGFFHFLFDLFMVVFTCGLWLIWIIIRTVSKGY